MTVSDARNLMERFRNDSLPRISDELFLDFLNDLNQFTQEQLVGVKPTSFIQQQSISVIEGTTAYIANSNFKNTLAEGCGLFRTNDSGQPINGPLPINREDQNSPNQGYRIFDSGIIEMIPTPKKSETMAFRYIPDLDELTTDTDQTLIPLNQKSYLKYAINTMLEEWYKNQNAEVFSDQKFARALDRFLNQMAVTPRLFNY